MDLERPAEARRRRRGYSLVEIIIAAALLAIAALTLSMVMVHSQRLDLLSRERSWAREECQRQMEQIIALDYKTVMNRAGTTSGFDVGFDIIGSGTSEKLIPYDATIPFDGTGGPFNPKGQVGTITYTGTSGASVADGTPGTGNSTRSGDADCTCVTVTAVWKTGTGRGGAGLGDRASISITCNIADH